MRRWLLCSEVCKSWKGAGKAGTVRGYHTLCSMHITAVATTDYCHHKLDVRVYHMADTVHYSYLQTYLASSVGKDCAQGKAFSVDVADCCVPDAILPS